MFKAWGKAVPAPFLHHGAFHLHLQGSAGNQLPTPLALPNHTAGNIITCTPTDLYPRSPSSLPFHVCPLPVFCFSCPKYPLIFTCGSRKAQPNSLPMLTDLARVAALPQFTVLPQTSALPQISSVLPQTPALFFFFLLFYFLFFFFFPQSPPCSLPIPTQGSPGTASRAARGAAPAPTYI